MIEDIEGKGNCKRRKQKQDEVEESKEFEVDTEKGLKVNGKGTEEKEK